MECQTKLPTRSVYFKFCFIVLEGRGEKKTSRITCRSILCGEKNSGVLILWGLLMNRKLIKLILLKLGQQTTGFVVCWYNEIEYYSISLQAIKWLAKRELPHCYFGHVNWCVWSVAWEIELLPAFSVLLNCWLYSITNYHKSSAVDSVAKTQQNFYTNNESYIL